MYRALTLAVVVAATPVAADTFDDNGVTRITGGKVGDRWELDINKTREGNMFCVLSKAWNASTHLKRETGSKFIMLLLKGFPVKGKARYYFELNADGFKVTKDKPYEGAVFFSSLKRPKEKDFKGTTGEFRGTSNTTVGIWVDSWFVNKFKASLHLNVVVGKLDIGYFPLKGSKNAMEVLEECTSRLVSGPDNGDTF